MYLYKGKELVLISTYKQGWSLLWGYRLPNTSIALGSLQTSN